MTMLRRGRLIPVPPVETAERFLKAEGLLDRSAAPNPRRLVLGSPPSRCLTTSVVRLRPPTLLMPATASADSPK